MISNGDFMHIVKESVYNQIVIANELLPLFDVTNMQYGLLYNVSELWSNFKEEDLIEHVKRLGYVYFEDRKSNGLTYRHTDIPDAGIEIIISNIIGGTYLLTSHTLPDLICYKGISMHSCKSHTQIYIKGIRKCQ